MAAPLLIGAIIGGIVTAIGTIVGRTLVSLGIGYVVYQGVDTSLTWARDQAFQYLNGLPEAALQVIGVLRVGQCISIVVSALAVRVALAGLTGGVKKMVQK